MFCLQNKKEGMVSDYSDSFVSSQNRSLYATFSSWHIDPCCFLFILSIVLNKISTFLFNTNDILNIFCIFAPV